MTTRKGICTLWSILALVGLLTTVGIWASVGVIATGEPDGYSGFAIGYSRPDSWAVTIVVHPDGFALGQYFNPYLGERSGLWGHRSRASHSHRLTLRHLIPSFRRGRIAHAMEFHLSLPLLLFGGMTGYTWVRPMIRRYLRRRRGLCVKCGYDLTGNESGTCPECGVGAMDRAGSEVKSR